MPLPFNGTSPEPRPSPWRRWIADPVRQQLTQGVSAEKIALTLAIGSALALFPVLGTTTVLCLLTGVALGLNQALIQAVNGLCAFIWIPMLFAFVRLGDALAGGPRSSLNLPVMISLFRHQPGEFFHRFGLTGLHAVLGWAAVVPFWIPLIYLGLRPPLRSAAARLGRR